MNPDRLDTLFLDPELFVLDSDSAKMEKKNTDK